MIEVETHLLASTEGYTTKGRSPGILQGELAELEELIHGQPEGPATMEALASQATACVRRLRATGRFALSRLLPGSPDSAGRQTIIVCTIVLAPADYDALCVSDLWSVLHAEKLWDRRNFASGRPLRLARPQPIRRAVTEHDVALFDAWLRARGTSRGLAALEASTAADQAIVRLAEVLDPSDRATYLWGCRLLSAQPEVHLASFADPGTVESARRTRIDVTSAPRTAAGRSALAESLGTERLPASGRFFPNPRVNVPATVAEIRLEEEGPLLRTQTGDDAVAPGETGRATSRRSRGRLMLISALVLLLVASIAAGGWWFIHLPPARPSTLAAEATQGAVALTWSAENKVGSYRVERREAAAPAGGAVEWTQMGTTESGSWKDDSATPGVVYAYRVFAVSTRDVASKEPSDEVTCKLPLVAPTDLRVLWNADQGQAIARWSPARGALRYGARAEIGPRQPFRTLALECEAQCQQIEIPLRPGERLIGLHMSAVGADQIEVPFVWAEKQIVEAPRAKAPTPPRDVAFIGCPGGSQEISWVGDAPRHRLRIITTRAGKHSDETHDVEGASWKCSMCDGTLEEVQVEVFAIAEDAGGELLSEPAKTSWRRPRLKAAIDVTTSPTPGADEARLTVQWEQKDVTVDLHLTVSGTPVVRRNVTSPQTFPIPLTDTVQSVQLRATIAWKDRPEALRSDCAFEQELPVRETVPAKDRAPEITLSDFAAWQDFLKASESEKQLPDSVGKELDEVFRKNKVDRNLSENQNAAKATEILKAWLRSGFAVAEELLEKTAKSPTPIGSEEEGKLARCMKRLVEAPALVEGRMLSLSGTNTLTDSAKPVIRDAQATSRNEAWATLDGRIADELLLKNQPPSQKHGAMPDTKDSSELLANLKRDLDALAERMKSQAKAPKGKNPAEGAPSQSVSNEELDAELRILLGIALKSTPKLDFRDERTAKQWHDEVRDAMKSILTLLKSRNKDASRKNAVDPHLCEWVDYVIHRFDQMEKEGKVARSSPSEEPNP